jgi:hypothetical protein
MIVPTRHHRTKAGRSRRQVAGRGTSRPLADEPLSFAAEREPRAPEPDQARERSAGGPEDRASYHCACGFMFEASVSASVGCPHCGSAQAW